MSSPLSSFMACLFMETLVADRHGRILGGLCTLLRYVDVILVIVPEGVVKDVKQCS